MVFGQDFSEYEKFKNLNIDSVWTTTITHNKIRFSITDTSFCEDLSPRRRDGYLVEPTDTISLSIRFEPDWNKRKKDSLHQRNLGTFNMIRSKLITHFDSTGNYGSKLVQYDELKECISCAYRVWRHIDSWSINELNMIHSVKSLPDYISNGTGIFIYLSVSSIGLFFCFKQVADLIWE